MLNRSISIYIAFHCKQFFDLETFDVGTWTRCDESAQVVTTQSYMVAAATILPNIKMYHWLSICATLIANVQSCSSSTLPQNIKLTMRQKVNTEFQNIGSKALDTNVRPTLNQYCRNNKSYYDIILYIHFLTIFDQIWMAHIAANVLAVLAVKPKITIFLRVLFCSHSQSAEPASERWLRIHTPEDIDNRVIISLLLHFSRRQKNILTITPKLFKLH